MNHKGRVAVVRSTSHLHYASKEGYETIQWQWVYLLTVYHSILNAAGVPKILYFESNLRVILGENDTLGTIKGL